ncbi:MAG: 4-oxalocrotonate tautomerase [Burkholderiales bacterium]|nr:4-oxalocrotonate tautomerase [Burkholderiales bacterium]
MAGPAASPRQARSLIQELNHPPRSKTMPTIRVEMFEGRTPEQKKEFVKAITEATVKTLGTSPEAVDVILTDIKKSDWATGGVLWSEKK